MSLNVTLDLPADVEERLRREAQTSSWTSKRFMPWSFSDAGTSTIINFPKCWGWIALKPTLILSGTTFSNTR